MGKRVGRKLLVASLGVGAISYVACGDAVANLVGPTLDAGTDAATDTATDVHNDGFSPNDLVANIVAPVR